jgi:hypothetical protein
MRKLFSIFMFLTVCALSSTFAQKVTIVDGTKNAGKVEWIRNIDIAEIPFGVPRTVEFLVKNISNEPLLFTNVGTTCGCTVAEYSKEPIAPGATTIIKAIYNAKTEGPFYKIVTVNTNFDKDNSVTLSLQGTVLKK